MYKLLTIALFLTLPVFSWSREKTGNVLLNQDSLLLKKLETRLQAGNKLALRDIASVIETSPKGSELLNNYTIFPIDIIDFSKVIDKQTLLDFYYKNQEKIVFSQLYNAFVYKNLSEIKPVYRHSPLIINKNTNSREINNQIQALFNENNIDSINALLSSQSIGNSSEIFTLLQNLSVEKKISNFSQTQQLTFYRNLADALSFFRKEEALMTLFQLVEKKQLPAGLISWPLARLTNVFAGHEVKDEQITSRYRFYLDSLKSLEAMRMFGYERYRPSMQRSFYDNDVDYFGALIATAFQKDNYWWVRENALADMMATKHPRLLFYLATQAFKERNKTIRYGYNSVFFIKMIEKWTGEALEVQNSKGNFTLSPQEDLVALKNYLAYWALHWEDYEWDEYRSVFTNKKQKLVEKEQYERLFRRFSSSNDSVAMQSYRELTEGDPTEIIKLSAKYRGLLRTVNINIPDFKYKFLEQTTLLTDFCRAQKIRYQTSAQEENLFYQLIDASSPTMRYVIENKIIQTLTIDQITPFEYWGLLHESRLSINFSISRILDYWYSNNWDIVTNNQSNFRLYLKKSYLLSKTNSSGTAATYAKKIDIKTPKIHKLLEQILDTESDPDIIEEAEKMLAPNINTSDNVEVSETNAALNLPNLLKQLAAKDNITIEELNFITQSTEYKQEYRASCLKALSKVAPIGDIFQLKIQPRLSIQKGELGYLEKINFDSRDLDDFPRIVEVDDAPKLFKFIMESAKNAPIDDLGSLVNNIFRSSWFSNYLTGGSFESAQANELKKILERYLNESELISEFEEQATARNIAQLEGYDKPIEERLQIAFNNINDDETKLKIMNEIIARISYNEISKVLPFVLQMESLSGKSAIAFLHEDFGIPIFEFDNEKAIQDFLQRHKTLTERDLYIIYLQKYGVDFQKNNGSLDFDKIYNILKFDLVTPYTRASGNRRDDYVYGIIKVLELSFGEKLGFHPKLNESQTFYSFNASKRAFAWMNYLKDKGLIYPEKHNEVMSFNSH